MRAAWTVIAALFLCLAVAAGGWLRYHSARYDAMIEQAAARNGIDFYLAKAVVYEESWFRPGIRGPSGEVGLMQVSMAAATDFATRKGFPAPYPERLEEPELNMEIGCWYLKQSLDRYRNAPEPVLFALLRYNAGEARSERWLQLSLAKPVSPGMSPESHYLSLVDFPKTREYVRRILQRYRSHNFWF